MGSLQHPVLLAVTCPVCLFAKSMPASFTGVHQGYLCPSRAQRMLSLQHLCWPVCCCIAIRTLTAASQLCVMFAPTHLA